MVRIEHTRPDLERFARGHYHELCQPPYDIVGKLRTFVRTAGTLAPAEHRAFGQLLAQHFTTILTGWPDELEQLKPTLSAAFRQVLAALGAGAGVSQRAAMARRQRYKQALALVFDYRKFTGTYSGYGAYQFTQNLQVNVCPYCNRQYTFTLDKKQGRTRPELDHFLDKATHPYFSLSYFNLVPSCHICNSNLKGSKTFTNDTHLNPYATCFHDVLNFSINVKTADFINGKVNSFTIAQKPDPQAPLALVEKARRNAAVFAHSELYSNHHDLVKELLLKAYHYTPERKRELAALKAPGTNRLLFQNEAEVNRFITGVYTEVAELGKRPMSKLIRDIGRELKLL